LHQYNPIDAKGSRLAAIWSDTYARISAEHGQEEPDYQVVMRRFIDKLRLSDEAPPPYTPMAWEGAGPYAMCNYDMWEACERIQAPTLVIHGTQSDLGCSHEKFLERIPKAQGLQLPSSVGHSVPFQHPTLWCREILSFLRSPDGATASPPN